MNLRQGRKVLKRAKNWWLGLWGVNVLSLMVGAFFVPFQYWAIWAIVGFGSMEGIGLVNQARGLYPPLTDVIRCFVPRTIALALMWGLLAAAASKWGISWSHPWEVMLFFGVVGWLTNHFIERYEKPATD